ncbi:transcriptional regulator, ArsR family [Sphingomonas gellani]|uniref:Transcriptional regulator, ArsR family n=1 Tax=Sphingomonas gellani TaxID=1166340 RepID=A0A1H8DCI4_9SPHN|nr:helix-turn-helix domain-containing protein [Sphingomonas gellani]SEN04866.1 transcriptional regulator, ArsR family [Sphingomonas gellani]
MRPLLHPSLDDIPPEAILHALADPDRAAMFIKIMTDGCVGACSALSSLGDRVIPKSSLSNHFKVLREAGLIRSERHGVEVRNHPRCKEVEARYPGLLEGIINAYAAAGRAPAATVVEE